MDYFQRKFGGIQRSTKKKGRKLIRVPRSIKKLPSKTYGRASDAVSDAVTHAMHQVQNNVETHMKHVAADVQARVIEEVKHNLPRVQAATEAHIQNIVADVQARVAKEIERNLPRVQAEVEARLQNVAADVQARVIEEFQLRQAGLAPVACAAVVAALSGITIAFGIVYFVTTLLVLPLWAGYIIVGVLFASTSAMLFVLGRNHLRRSAKLAG